MNEPTLLRVVRPYPTVDAYLAAEAHTFETRSMVLLGVEPLPEGALVRFVVSLSNGEVVVKAEGRVRGFESSDPSREGGLRVVFKRFGSVTKQFIDRAVSYGAQGAGPSSKLDCALETPGPAEHGLADGSSEADAGPISAVSVRPSAELTSGVRHRIELGGGVPANRDELLARLRQHHLAMTTERRATAGRRAG